MYIAKSVKFKNYIVSLLGVGTLTFFILLSGSYFTLNTMKNSFEKLYSSNILSINTLSQLHHHYGNTILALIQDIQTKQLPSSEQSYRLQESIQTITALWNQYESTINEYEYPQDLHDNINNSLAYLNQFALKAHNRPLSYSDGENIKHHIRTMESAIQEQINRQSQQASYEKRSMQNSFNTTIKTLLVIVLLLAIVMLALSTSVFQCLSNFIHIFSHVDKKFTQAQCQISALTLLDEATGLYNEKYFCMVVGRELHKAMRTKEATALMLVGIDYFKEYSDFYGKKMASALLKEIAVTLQKEFKRPTDYLFRFDNDTFAILITHAEIKNSEKMGEVLRYEVQKLGIEHKQSPYDEVTLSMGIVTLAPNQEGEGGLLLSKADSNLNFAKSRGSNQVIITGY